MVIEMNSDIKMNTNPSYIITKQNSRRQEDQNDYICISYMTKFSFQNNAQDTIKV